MQKIMFSDEYGLTEAVLNGRKIMSIIIWLRHGGTKFI